MTLFPMLPSLLVTHFAHVAFFGYATLAVHVALAALTALLSLVASCFVALSFKILLN